MTAPAGIAHSEQSPADRPAMLHGVQLWVALPEVARHMPAAFAHHADLPVLRDGAATITVFAGDLVGERSPATFHTPLLGAEIMLDAAGVVRLPLRPGFEYALLSLAGTVSVAGDDLGPGPLLYLGTGRGDLTLTAHAGPARVLLLGGEPFEERILMWWNLVGRSHDEIVAGRADWEAGRRFGTVDGWDGQRLPAPPLPATPLRPRGRHR